MAKETAEEAEDMARKSRLTAIGVMVCMAVFVPAMLAIVSPASAALTLLANLNFTNLSGLPEGTTTFGTVSEIDTGGTPTGLEWSLNSFTNGGITYTAVGIDNVCWQNTTTTGSNSCDSFGHDYTFAASSGASPPFVNPLDVSTTDTTANFAAHVKWNSSTGSSCTGFIGNTAPSDNTSTNDCLSAVPEPGTAALMLAGIPGLVGMAAIGRRRRARSTPARG